MIAVAVLNQGALNEEAAEAFDVAKGSPYELCAVRTAVLDAVSTLPQAAAVYRRMLTEF